LLGGCADPHQEFEYTVENQVYQEQDQ